MWRGGGGGQPEIGEGADSWGLVGRERESEGEMGQGKELAGGWAAQERK